MICQNPSCNKKISKKRKKYCSIKCGRKHLYLRKRESYIAYNKEWKIENPEKTRESNRKGLEKFRKNNPKRFNELILKSYYKNKDKWSSRNYTHKIIEFKRKIDMNKVCKKCKSKENLSLKFEVYPKKAKEIRQAIKKGKIYYLCKECRYGN